HLALTASGEVGKDAARRQHVEAPSHEGLKELDPRGELAELEVQTLLLVGAELLTEHELGVDGDHVQVSDVDLGRGLREDGRSPGGGGGRRATRELQKAAAIDVSVH